MTRTENFLTAITTATTFETTDRGRDLLIAMRELLANLEAGEFDSRGYVVDPKELEGAFLTLFQLWLGKTGYKVPTIEAPTIEDAFTAIYAVSATHGVPA